MVGLILGRTPWSLCRIAGVDASLGGPARMGKLANSLSGELRAEAYARPPSYPVNRKPLNWRRQAGKRKGEGVNINRRGPVGTGVSEEDPVTLF